MGKIPSFRPRSALGVQRQDGLVGPSPEFLRWLDLVVRWTDDTGGFVDLQELAPLVMPSQPVNTGVSPIFRPAAAQRDLAPLLRTCAPQNGLAPL